MFPLHASNFVPSSVLTELAVHLGGSSFSGCSVVVFKRQERMQCADTITLAIRHHHGTSYYDEQVFERDRAVSQLDLDKVAVSRLVQRWGLRGYPVASNYQLFAHDVQMALAADIAERFGNLPVRVTYGPEIPFNVWTLRILTESGDGVMSLQCVSPAPTEDEYNVLKDAVLMTIWQQMEEEEEDE